MPDPESRFACSTDIASEVIDGEAIIINMSTGTYYSARDTGAFVWPLLAAGLTVAEVMVRVTDRYDVAPERVATDLAVFVATATRDRLLAPGASPVSVEPVEPPSGPKLPYAALELTSYHDMADLLALDPPTPGVLDHLMRDAPRDPPR